MKMEAKHEVVMFILFWRTASLHIVDGSNIHTRNSYVTSDAGLCVYAQSYCVRVSANSQVQLPCRFARHIIVTYRGSCFPPRAQQSAN